MSATTPVDPFRVGASVLDAFEVRGLLGRGGMGCVHRVLHRGWGIELAMKSAVPDALRSDALREALLREAQMWIELPHHPHVVTCHQVRVLDGLPLIFSELLGGGSLADAIASGRLYEGDPASLASRLVSVARHIAWGLAHAHRNGVVHQDVKPANVLASEGGTWKLGDFGVSRARDAARVPSTTAATGAASATRTVFAPFGGLTVEYASPEQAAMHARPRDAQSSLTQRTDVWSWALVVLEMFAGERFWSHGVAGPEALEEHLSREAQSSRAKMPAAVLEVLRACLVDVAARPRDLDALASALASDARARPAPVVRTAHELNNRALSHLDLGDRERARALLTEAVALEPLHLEATYNLGLLRYRAGEITALAVVDELTKLSSVMAAAVAQPLEHVRREAQIAGEVDALPAVNPFDRWIYSDDFQRKLSIEKDGVHVFRTRPRHEEIFVRKMQCAIGTRVGNMLVVAAIDGSFTAFSFPDLESSFTLPAQKQAPIAMAALGDRRVVSLSQNGRVRIYDLSTRRVEHEGEVHRSATTVAAHATRNVIVFGSTDGRLDVFWLDSGQRRSVSRPGAIESVHVTADGDHAVVARGGGELWDLGRGILLRPLPLDRGGLRRYVDAKLVSRPAPPLFARAGIERRAEDAADFEALLEGARTAIDAADVESARRRVERARALPGRAHDREALRLWSSLIRTRGPASLREVIPIHRFEPTPIDESDWRSRLEKRVGLSPHVSVADSPGAIHRLHRGHVQSFDKASWKVRATSADVLQWSIAEAYGERVPSALCAISADGSHGATLQRTEPCTVVVVAALRARRLERATAIACAGSIESVALDRHARRIAVCETNGAGHAAVVSIRIYDVASGGCIQSLEVPKSLVDHGQWVALPAESLAFSTDGTHVVSSHVGMRAARQRMRTFDLASGKEVPDLTPIEATQRRGDVDGGRVWLQAESQSLVLQSADAPGAVFRVDTRSTLPNDAILTRDGAFIASADGVWLVDWKLHE